MYVCQLARELSKHGQPFSDRRCLHDTIPPPLQAKAVTHPHEQRRKARPRRATRLLKLGQVTDRSDFHLTSRSLSVLIRSTLNAFINVSMNLIFMHWISKINSPLIMQNNRATVSGPADKPETELSVSIWTVMILIFHLQQKSSIAITLSE